jgi:hypothetical protein
MHGSLEGAPLLILVGAILGLLLLFWLVASGLLGPLV